MKIMAHVKKVENEKMPHIKAYADITLEDCCKLNNIQVIQRKDGELFAQYPQKDLKENGQVKMGENGYPVQTDVYYANSKEVNDAIKNLVLDAYNSEKGVAFINPQKGSIGTSKIDINLHACNDENSNAKASGRLLVGGYMHVTDIFVNLYTKENGDQFLDVSYPSYKSGDEYKEMVEPLQAGSIYNYEKGERVPYNFKKAVEGAMLNQTVEFHPELAAVLKPHKSIDEKIADAKAVAEGAAGAKGKEAELEQNM